MDFPLSGYYFPEIGIGFMQKTMEEIGNKKEKSWVG
jgi:hypothetical protein